mmetsp:Transcript_28146/g.65766  ORF Transcript_28146/g.65766 Transcript_28146/m.65766 type:complete len:105 (-) Transcript_28146:147-461(-)
MWCKTKRHNGRVPLCKASRAAVQDAPTTAPGADTSPQRSMPVLFNSSVQLVLSRSPARMRVLVSIFYACTCIRVKCASATCDRACSYVRLIVFACARHGTRLRL